MFFYEVAGLKAHRAHVCVCVCLGVLWGKDAAVLCHCLPGQIPPSHTPLSAAFSGGSQYVSLSLAAELEFVQIIIIVVVMMVMVVVITCLLNHYKLSARSFISRHSQGRRRDENLSSVSHTLLFPSVPYGVVCQVM